MLFNVFIQQTLTLDFSVFQGTPGIRGKKGLKGRQVTWSLLLEVQWTSGISSCSFLPS